MDKPSLFDRNLFIWKDGENGKKIPHVLLQDGYELSIFELTAMIDLMAKSGIDIDPELARKFFRDASYFVLLITAYLEIDLGIVDGNDVDPEMFYRLGAMEPESSMWDIIIDFKNKMLKNNNVFGTKNLKSMH